MQDCFGVLEFSLMSDVIPESPWGGGLSGLSDDSSQVSDGVEATGNREDGCLSFRGSAYACGETQDSRDSMQYLPLGIWGGLWAFRLRVVGSQSPR